MPRARADFKQGGALLEHAVVVTQDRAHARRTLDEELVGEAAPGGWVSTNDLEVFRREEHDLRVARKLRGLHGSTVDARLVGALPVHLRLEQHLAVTVGEPRADDRGIRAITHHRRIAGDAVRAERREERDRFGEVRLALTVAADEHVRTGAERDIGDRIVAEVDETQLLHDHGINPSSGG